MSSATQQQRYRIGFTGSRKGMTDNQLETLRNELLSEQQTHAGHQFQVHHGDAQGADAQFHALCQKLGFAIVIHPATDNRDRAYCQGAIETRQPVDFRQQSVSIITTTELLIAAPDGMRERLRGSGTWNTIRAARKLDARIVICFPNGDCTEELP